MVNVIPNPVLLPFAILVGLQCLARPAFPEIEIVRAADQAKADAELIAELDSKLEDYRQRAVVINEALSTLEEKPRYLDVFVERLIELTSHPDDEVRGKSIELLAQVRGYQWSAQLEECLVKLFRDEDSRVRYRAVEAVKHRDRITDETATVLLKLLEEADGEIAYSILRMLESCTNLRQRALPQLKSLLAAEKFRKFCIANDICVEVPVAWDAARMLVKDYGSETPEIKSVLEETYQTTRDLHLKVIVSFGLDDAKDGNGPFMTALHEVFANEVGRVPYWVINEICYAERFESDRSYQSIVSRLKLLIICSQTGAEFGIAASRRLLRESEDWTWVGKQITELSKQESIPMWLKEATREWVQSRRSLLDD